MSIHRFSLTALLFLGFAIHGHLASAQERNLPEEIRALAVVCSTGASIEFRGEIEGGINRLLGKVLEGEGELEKSERETEFLNSFEDDKLRIEARKIYDGCVRDALQMVYNLKQDKALETSDTRLLVPDSLKQLRPGEKFALRKDDSIGLDQGGIVSVYNTFPNCGRPQVRISNDGNAKTATLDLSANLLIPGRQECWITLYEIRASDDKAMCVYSFLYECR